MSALDTTIKTDSEEMDDASNPDYLFSGTYITLLVAASHGKIDLNKLAKRELANRGLDVNGEWVGFDLAAASL